jgi:hypothetical protein
VPEYMCHERSASAGIFEDVFEHLVNHLWGYEHRMLLLPYKPSLAAAIPSTAPTVVTGDDLSSLSLGGHDVVSAALNIARSLLVGDYRMVEEAGEYVDGALRGTRSNFCGSAFSSCPEISARRTAGWAVASLMFRVTLSSGAQVSS